MKNVEKKRVMSRIFSMMLAGGVIASSFACTWAADMHESDTTDVSVALTKNYMMPTGVTQPAADFGFAYTKDGVVTGDSKVDSTVVEDSTQPDLTALDKESNKDMSYATDATKTGDVSGKDVYVKTISNILPASTDFAHAGEYVYTISETANTNSSIDASMTYSQAEYKMHVFVKNKSGGGLLVAGAAVYQTKNDAGETGTNAKVDLDDSTLLKGKGGNDFQFTNTYSPSSEKLAISKTVTGDYADLTKAFSMNITLTNPATVTTTTYNAAIVDSSTGKPVSTTLESFTAGTAKEVKLKSGQKLVFVESGTTLSTDTAITDAQAACMPAGLTYTVVEKAATDYTPKATVTHGGTVDKQTSGSAGTDFTVNTNTIVDTGSNITAMLSEYHAISVTGVIVRLLPAALMVLMAVIGILIGMKTNKRA